MSTIYVKRIKDHSTAAVAADMHQDNTKIPLDDGGWATGRIASLLELVRGLADVSEANETGGVVATLDGTGKLKLSQRPSGAQSYVGDWDPETNIPALTDAGGSNGQVYRINIVSGAASFARDLGVGGSKTWNQGGTAEHDGTEFDSVKDAANIFNGSGSTAQAAAAGNYHETEDVNDRSNARQPANGAYYDGTAKNDAANNAATNPGTGDLTIAALVTFPDSVSTTNTIAGTRTTTSGYQFFLRASGALGIMLQDTSANAVSSTDDGGSLVGRTAHVVAVIDRTANTMTRYVDGVPLDTVDDISSVVATITNANGFHMGHRNSDFYLDGGIIHSVVPFNRALTAAEVLKLYKRGNVPEVDDQWADNTTQTSGTLTVGQKYRIDTYVSSDDFTNVGAASNATGVKFVATGTTPTTYSNGSTLRTIGAVAAYLPENIESDGTWIDASSNELNATATNVTPLRTKPQVSGNWTPNLKFGAGTNNDVSTSHAFGTWRMLDDKTVEIEGRITLDGSGGALGTDTGSALIDGLPKQPKLHSNNAAIAMVTPFNMTGLAGPVVTDIYGVDSEINLYESGATGAVAITHARFTTTSALRIHAVYQIE